MKQELSTWAVGVMMGGAIGAGIWLLMDAFDPTTSSLVLALSIGLALGVAQLWTSAARKRREWRAGERAAQLG
jgi:hypothetical protein